MSDMHFVLKLAGATPDDFSRVLPGMVCRMGDEGVRAVAQMVDADGNPVNLHGASNLKLKFLKPSGATYDATAVFLTNGYDGRLYFKSTDVLPPFDQVGVWFLQAKVTVGGVRQSTDWGGFTVQPNIDAS